MNPTAYTYQSGGQTFTATPNANATPAQLSAVANNSAFTPINNQSLTTLSSNKSSDIANSGTTLNTLGTKGVTTNPTTGISTFANGTVANSPGLEKPIEPDTAESDAAILANLDKMQSLSDANTATQLENIRQKFDQRRLEQDALTKSTGKNLQNALLMGGVTGKGSSAQYAPISSQGIITANENYGLKKLAEIDALENDAIAAAQDAQLSGNFRILESKNAQIQKIRDEKIAVAKKLNEDIAKRNNDVRQSNIKSTRDTQVADLYSQGITDTATILKKLNYDDKGNQINNYTAKDISDTLKDIVPVGLDDLVKTLRTNGAPQDVIGKVLSSKDMNEAYNNAGFYASGGTGIVGEYNYAKANGYTGSFSQYQNEDANRKIKIVAAANAAGLTPAMTNTALKLSDDYEARSKDFYTQREAYNRVLSSASDPSPAGDLSLIFNYMKVLDPNSTVREGEFATAQNAGSAFNVLGAKYNKIVNGERLTESQRKDFVDRVTKLFLGAKAQQDSVAQEFKTRAKQYGVPDNLVVRDTSATGSKGLDAANSQRSDEIKLQTFITNNPNRAVEINDKIKKAEAARGAPLTATEFLIVYPEYNQ